MFKAISKEIKRITPEEATQFLAYNNFQSQRNLRQWHVNYLARAMEEDRFRTGEIAFAIMPDGSQFLMNGQHVLNGSVNSGRPIDVLIERFECRSVEDLEILYCQFDCNPVRSIRDMVRVVVDTMKLDWPYHTAGLVVSGLFIISNESSTMNRNEKVALLKKNLEAGHFINNLFTGSEKNKILERAPVVAVMIQTWRIAPDEAYGFWKRVRSGAMLEEDSPEFRLRDYLHGSLYIRISYGRDYTRVTGKEIRCKCVMAWNAFRKGKTTKLSFSPRKPIPKVI